MFLVLVCQLEVERKKCIDIIFKLLEYLPWIFWNTAQRLVLVFIERIIQKKTSHLMYLHCCLVLCGLWFDGLFSNFLCLFFQMLAKYYSSISHIWTWQSCMKYLHGVQIWELALLMNELLKKQTLYTFIFILPTLTLGPKFAPFLFTPEDIQYKSEILSQFWLWINHLFPQGCKLWVKN